MKVSEDLNIPFFIFYDKLTIIKKGVPDSALVMITLNGLGEDYRMFLTFIVSREKVPALHELRPLLLAEEARYHSSIPASSPNQALIAQVSNNPPFIGRGRRGRGQGRGKTTPTGLLMILPGLPLLLIMFSWDTWSSSKWTKNLACAKKVANLAILLFDVLCATI